MSQVAEALDRAGYKSSKKRFETIVLKAIIENPESEAKAARAVWAAVRNSLPLVLELIGYRPQDLAARAVSDFRRDLGVQSIQFFDNRTSTDPFWTAPPDFTPSANALQRQAQVVFGAWQTEDKLRAKKQLEDEEGLLRRKNAREEAADNLWLATQAARVQVNGRPFWEVSANEAERAANSMTQDAAFLFMAIEGIPRNGSPIGNFLRPQEVNALWARAKNAV